MPNDRYWARAKCYGTSYFTINCYGKNLVFCMTWFSSLKIVPSSVFLIFSWAVPQTLIGAPLSAMTVSIILYVTTWTLKSFLLFNRDYSFGFNGFRCFDVKCIDLVRLISIVFIIISCWNFFYLSNIFTALLRCI